MVSALTAIARTALPLPTRFPSVARAAPGPRSRCCRSRGRSRRCARPNRRNRGHRCIGSQEAGQARWLLEDGQERSACFWCIAEFAGLTRQEQCQVRGTLSMCTGLDGQAVNRRVASVAGAIAFTKLEHGRRNRNDEKHHQDRGYCTRPPITWRGSSECSSALAVAPTRSRYNCSVSADGPMPSSPSSTSRHASYASSAPARSPAPASARTSRRWLASSSGWIAPSPVRLRSLLPTGAAPTWHPRVSRAPRSAPRSRVAAHEQRARSPHRGATDRELCALPSASACAVLASQCPNASRACIVASRTSGNRQRPRGAAGTGTDPC